MKNSVRVEEKLKQERAAQRHSAYLEKFRAERAQMAADQAREAQRREARLAELRDELIKQRRAEQQQSRKSDTPEPQQKPSQERKQKPPKPAVRVKEATRIPPAREKTVRPIAQRKGVPEARPERKPLPSAPAKRVRQRAAPPHEKPVQPGSPRKALVRPRVRGTVHGRATRRAEALRQQQTAARNADRKTADVERGRRSDIRKRIGAQRVEEHRQLRASQTEKPSAPIASRQAEKQRSTPPRTPPAGNKARLQSRLAARSQARAEARAQSRAQTRAKMAAPPTPAAYNEARDNLLWLRTDGSFIVDENGTAVTLRGITVTGLDTAAPAAGQSLADAICLDEANLTTMTDLWGINIVRIPFQAQTILKGNAALSASALLSGLDDAISDLADLNVYVLLSLQAPVAQGASAASQPDQSIFDCWQMLCQHYQDEPAVLFEIYASSLAVQGSWPSAAQMIIGSIRSQHPSSLLFVSSGLGGADTTGLPLRFTTGDPVANLVYTISIGSGQQLPLALENSLATLSQSFPVFAAEWTDTSASEFDRSAEGAANLFGRYGVGWAAGNWNSAPPLVIDAAAHNFVATRWGSAVQRAMILPPKEPLERLLP